MALSGILRSQKFKQPEYPSIHNNPIIPKKLRNSDDENCWHANGQGLDIQVKNGRLNLNNSIIEILPDPFEVMALAATGAYPIENDVFDLSVNNGTHITKFTDASLANITYASEPFKWDVFTSGDVSEVKTAKKNRVSLKVCSEVKYPEYSQQSSENIIGILTEAPSFTPNLRGAVAKQNTMKPHDILSDDNISASNQFAHNAALGVIGAVLSGFFIRKMFNNNALRPNKSE